MRTDWTPKEIRIDADLPDHLILFDGVCNLCSGWVKFVIKRDPERKFHFVSAQSDVGQGLMRICGLNHNDFDSNLYLEKGVSYYKMDTVTGILNVIGGGWKLINIVKILPRRFRNWVYDRIARNRYSLFGRTDTCLVPNADIRERFIDV